MWRIGVTAMLALGLCGAASAAPDIHVALKRPLTTDEQHLSNLKDWMPIHYKQWQEQIPTELYTSDLRWLTHFEGVEGNMRALIIDGKKVLVGGVCQPRWCVNDVEVVIAADHISGLAHFQNLYDAESILTIGKLSVGELQCLTKLRKNANAQCSPTPASP